MKKHFLHLLLFMCVCCLATAQSPTDRLTAPTAPVTSSLVPGAPDRCITTPALAQRIARDPIYRAFQREAVGMTKTSPGPVSGLIPCDGTNSIVVPVAFHFAADVITCGELDCLREEVQDQLDVINMQFGDNTGTANEANCPMAYQDANGNSVTSTGTCISFCLAEPPIGTAANIQPGDPAITVGVFDGGINAGGIGAPGWGGILNIFIISNDAGFLGVADGIPGAGNGDGVSVIASAFGGFAGATCAELDDDTTPFDLGVTLTHEIGHYLGLFHVHNDFGTGCVDNDVMAPGPFTVTDTPIQANPSFGCNMTCIPSCTPGDFEPTANFMSFSDDLCLSVFTEDQAAVLNFWANTLFGASAGVCGPALDEPIAGCSIAAAFAPADGSTFDICLDDGGSFQLTDLSTLATSWDWSFVASSGDLVFTPATSTVANPVITFTGGTSGTIDVTLEVCDADGICDEVTQTYTINLLTGDDCPDTCDYTLELTDTFGDGWNGAILDVTANGVPIAGSPFGTAFTAGASEINMITLTNGDVIDFTQTNGGFPGEEGFVITDPFGNIIFDTSMGNVGSGLVFSFTVECTAPTCDDGMQNGAETGVDCGGPICDPCPVCMDGFEEIINEDFESCMMPAGWSVTATDGGTGDITFNQGPMDVPGGQMPSPDFAGCIAIIDDDANDAIGFGCILTPIIDASQFTNLSLNFDWHTNDFAGSGDFVVEVFDGTVWVQVFIEENDAFGTDQMISLAGFTNSDFQIRFCYDDEGAFAWGAGIDNVGVCGETNDTCPAVVEAINNSGEFCDGAATTVSATANPNVTYTWSSSNPNVVIVDPAAASSSVELSALTPCQIETAEISLVAVCNLDGTELFNGVVSTFVVYPAPPADITTLVIVNPETCDDPVMVDPNCDAFITLTPDAGNPTFPVEPGDSGTASYTITYASPAGAPDCCPMAPVDAEIVIGGADATQNVDGDLELIGGAGGMDWTSTSTNFGTVLCDAGCGPGGGSVNYGVAPNSAAWLAWFGGAAGALEIGTLETTVVIPECSAGDTELTFGFENSACGSAADFIELQIDGAVVWSDDGDPTTCGVMGVPLLITVDLSAFADGASHTILFTSTTGLDGVSSSNFTVDNVMLSATSCSAAVEDICVATISSDFNCEEMMMPPPIEEIPTMGEWGLMILALMILIVSIVAIREQKQVLEKA